MENLTYCCERKITLSDFERVAKKCNFNIEYLNPLHEPRLNIIVDPNNSKRVQYWSISPYQPTPDKDGWTMEQFQALKKQIQYQSSFDIEHSYQTAPQLITFFTQIFNHFGGVLCLESFDGYQNLFFNEENIAELSLELNKIYQASK